MTTLDLVDSLVGIAAGSPLDGIRRSRGEARTNVQRAEEALFGRETNGVGLRDRWLMAAFTTGLTAPGSALDEHRAARLDAPDRALVGRLVVSARQRGPWGSYREPGLVHENVAGDDWRVPVGDRAGLGEPLAVVLEYAHRLLLHPRDARPEALERLVGAGWSREAIVTWSQVVSFVAFQARLVEGLSVLAGEGSQ